MTVLDAPTPLPTPPNGRAPPPSSIKIRDATKKDIEAVANLGATVFANSFGWSMPQKDLEQYLIDAYSIPNMTKDFESADTDIIVATDERHEVVGFAQLTRGTTEPCLHNKSNFCELQRLYVREDQHSKGIGSSLMNRIDEMAAQQGFKGMWIGVWEENVKAQRVYSRQGFKKVGTHDFKCGEEVQTDWIMWKDL